MINRKKSQILLCGQKKTLKLFQTGQQKFYILFNFFPEKVKPREL